MMTRDLAAGNSLLQRVDERTLEELEAESIAIRPGDVLQPAATAETHAHFPITAVVSMVSRLAGGASVEIATVGREGVTGFSDLIGPCNSPTENIVVVGGTCVRIPTAALRHARERRPSLRAALDEYTTARFIQITQISACDRLHPIGGRLPRWLLGLHDRADTDTFALGQQTIADMLGVHRPTIAAELQRLDKTGALRYRGRRVMIVDRARLETLACECHALLHQQLIRRRTAAAWPDTFDANEVERVRELSHELRTPLHVILGWCALAKSEPARSDALTIIERQARAQLALLDELLE